MNYLIVDREKAINVETWESNVTVIENSKQQHIAHTNHTLQENAPVIFEIANEGSFGYTIDRLKLANNVLSKNAQNIDFEGLQELKSTRPILNNRPNASSRTIMGTIISVPKSGSPILWTTPDSPNLFGHVKFTF